MYVHHRTLAQLVTSLTMLVQHDPVLLDPESSQVLAFEGSNLPQVEPFSRSHPMFLAHGHTLLRRLARGQLRRRSRARLHACQLFQFGRDRLVPRHPGQNHRSGKLLDWCKL